MELVQSCVVDFGISTAQPFGSAARRLVHEAISELKKRGYKFI
jgi:hypothetical protein